MKRYISVIISSVWLVMCILILVVSSAKVKYPSVTAGFVDIVVFTAMIVPLTICLIFSIFNAVKNNTGKRRIFLWVAIAILFSGFIKFYVIDGISLVVSYTTDIDNYLLVDDDISSEVNVIKSVFPESIASDSSDIKYRYYRPAKDDFEITVEYSAGKDLFEAEKIRCKAAYDDISDTFAKDKAENVFKVDVGDDSYTAIIKFNDEKLSISYQLYHRQ